MTTTEQEYKPVEWKKDSVVKSFYHGSKETELGRASANIHKRGNRWYINRTGIVPSP